MTATATQLRRGYRPRAMVLALIATMFAFTAVGSAAQLNVNTATLTQFQLAKCTGNTMSVHVSPTGISIGFNKSAVQITNFPASCHGELIQVDVRNGSGTLLASGTATCTGSPCVVSTGSYDARNAAASTVLASTWGLESSWDSSCGTFLIFMSCT